MISSVSLRILRWVSSDDGATAVEYAILASLIAAVIVGVTALIGTRVLEMFTSVVTNWGG